MKSAQVQDGLIADLATVEGWRRSYPELTKEGPSALESILRGMQHSNWRVRMWCCEFMDHFADQRCTEALVAALRDPVADVRRHALHSLGCQTCKAEALRVDVVPLLLDRALHDPSIRVRRAAAHMLGNQGPDERVATELTEITEHAGDRKLKSNARWAIKQSSSRMRKEPGPR